MKDGETQFEGPKMINFLQDNCFKIVLMDYKMTQEQDAIFVKETDSES